MEGMNPEIVVLVSILAALAASGAVVALGVWALPKLRNEVQGYPLEVQIEAALLPLAFEGICAAYRVSEMSMDELGERLRGADKKRIADLLYDMLPDSVGGFPLMVIKSMVSRERFGEIVEAAFAQFDRRFIEHRARYEQLFEEWKRDMQREREGEGEGMTLGTTRLPKYQWVPVSTEGARIVPGAGEAAPGSPPDTLDNPDSE